VMVVYCDTVVVYCEGCVLSCLIVVHFDGCIPLRLCTVIPVSMMVVHCDCYAMAFYHDSCVE
jgi:hypothetical protein